MKAVDNRVRIAPSILAADFTRLGEQVSAAESAGADLIHIDVMDGRFVPNITMGPLVVEAVRRVTTLPLDVHLMIVEPERYVTAFADAGASAITVHYEASPNLHRTLQHIRETGCKAGVALNPHTSANAVHEVVNLLDVIIVMTVNPGFGGQQFLRSMLPKITALRGIIQAAAHPIALEVDGGITRHNAAEVVRAGADVLIAGSSVFNTDHTVQEGIQAIRTSVQSEGG